MASTASTASAGGRGTAAGRDPPAQPPLHYHSIATSSTPPASTATCDGSRDDDDADAAAGSIALISSSASASHGTARHRCHQDREGDESTWILPPSTSHPTPPSTLPNVNAPALAHATYHTVSSILGAGVVLALPSSLAHLGWPCGLTLFFICTAVSYYTGICLIDLQSSSTAITDYDDGSSSSSSVDDDHEGRHSQGGVATTYSEVVDSVMGDGFADRFVRPFQFLVFFTVLIGSLILGGETMALMMDAAATVPRSSFPSSEGGGDDDGLLATGRTGPWIGVTGAALFLLGLAPNLSSDASWRVSLVGTVASVLLTIVVLVGSALALSSEGAESSVDYGRPKGETTADYAFGTLNAFGLITFAYGGHSVLPDVQASIATGAQSCIPPATTTHQTAGTIMTDALRIAYAVIFTCYLSVTCVGYAAFGSSVTPGYVLSDVASHLGPGTLLCAYGFIIANTFAICTVYNQAAFVFLEDVLLPPHRHEFLGWSDDPMWRIKLATRFGYISVATIVAVSIPFFDSVAGLSGAIGFTPMTFVYPPILWNFSPRGKAAAKWRRVTNWVLAVGFGLLGTCGAAGSLYGIAKEGGVHSSSVGSG